MGCLILGISQIQIAEAVGTSKQEVSHVASGRYRSGKIVDGVARALKCTPAWLVDGLGEAPAWYSAAPEIPAESAPAAPAAPAASAQSDAEVWKELLAMHKKFQEINERLRSSDDRNHRQEEENAALRAQVERLERLVRERERRNGRSKSREV